MRRMGCCSPGTHSIRARSIFIVRRPTWMLMSHRSRGWLDWPLAFNSCCPHTMSRSLSPVIFRVYLTQFSRCATGRQNRYRRMESENMSSKVSRSSCPNDCGCRTSAESASWGGTQATAGHGKNERSPKSRLRAVEHVKEHSHGEATKRIDERREQHHRRNQTAQDIEEGEDERPH